MTISQEFIDNVFLLGIKSINDYYGIYAAIMPFINEFANLFTITYFKPYYKTELYPHHANTLGETIRKSLIDMLAITGIAANASGYGQHYSRSVGLVKGSLFAFFTFFIPNVFMEQILNISKSYFMKFIIGLIFIYILDICVHAITFLYIKQTKNQNKQHDTNIKLYRVSRSSFAWGDLPNTNEKIE